MSALRAWLADRLGLDELGDTLRGGHVPGGASLWHTLGTVAAGLFVRGRRSRTSRTS